jgi:hypothetical protein
MAKTLDVYLFRNLVGVQDDVGQMVFNYAESWTETSNAFPLSHSLPLRMRGCRHVSSCRRTPSRAQLQLPRTPFHKLLNSNQCGGRNFAWFFLVTPRIRFSTRPCIGAEAECGSLNEAVSGHYLESKTYEEQR